MEVVLSFLFCLGGFMNTVTASMYVGGRMMV